MKKNENGKKKLLQGENPKGHPRAKTKFFFEVSWAKQTEE